MGIGHIKKDADYVQLIHSARWVRLRRLKLGQDPLCEDCLREGRLRSATEVHHMRPVESVTTRQEKENLMFDIHNLRSLCHECHVKEHRQMGRSGSKEHTRERTKEKLEDFRKRFGFLGQVPNPKRGW